MKHLFLIIVILCSLSGISQPKLKKVKTHYPDGTLKGVYHVQKSNQNIKEGNYKGFYLDRMQMEGPYQNNQRNGKWTFYHWNEQKSCEGEYSNGSMDGIWQFYSEEGQIKTSAYYSNGYRDSIAIYDHNGTFLYTNKYFRYKKEGDRWYYQNGNIESERIPTADTNIYIEKEYFHTGQLHSEIIYKDKNPYTVIHTYNINGNAIDGGNLKEGTGEIIRYYLPESDHHSDTLVIKFIQKATKSHLDGRCFLFHKDGKIASQEFYKNGILIASKGFDSKGKQIFEHKFDGINYPKVLTKIGTIMPLMDIQPRFPTGDNGRLKFLMRCIKYPEFAKSQGISGTLYFSFVVEITGELSDFNILKGVHPTIDNEALHAVKMMPNWEPGEAINEGPARVRFSMPIKFTL